MSLLRGLLLDNLGLKLVALLLALVVYLHVFTERTAVMVVTFPIHIEGLADSLALAGSPPPSVQAELEGTGKQFIRLWLTEPRIEVSLAGVGPGTLRRILSAEDLPLIASDRLKVQRLIGPDTLRFELERKVERLVSIAARVEGVPGREAVWSGETLVEPQRAAVSGPRRAVAAVDSVRLEPVRIAGRRDSVRAEVRPVDLPAGVMVEPATFVVIVPLGGR